MMVNVHEAKTTLSRLLRRVEAGEEIVIGKAGVPVAKLIPFTAVPARREPGAWKGQVRIAADFDSLPDELAGAFSGEDQ